MGICPPTTGRSIHLRYIAYRSLLDTHHTEGLDNVADLEIVEVLDQYAALETLQNFASIILAAA